MPAGAPAGALTWVVPCRIASEDGAMTSIVGAPGEESRLAAGKRLALGAGVGALPAVETVGSPASDQPVVAARSSEGVGIDHVRGRRFP